MVKRVPGGLSTRICPRNCSVNIWTKRKPKDVVGFKIDGMAYPTPSSATVSS
jgi:hypothetical protein